MKDSVIPDLMSICRVLSPGTRICLTGNRCSLRKSLRKLRVMKKKTNFEFLADTKSFMHQGIVVACHNTSSDKFSQTYCQFKFHVRSIVKEHCVPTMMNEGLQTFQQMLHTCTDFPCMCVGQIATHTTPVKILDCANRLAVNQHVSYCVHTIKQKVHGFMLQEICWDIEGTFKSPGVQADPSILHLIEPARTLC